MDGADRPRRRASRWHVDHTDAGPAWGLLGAEWWGLKLGVRAAYYPLPLFVATQLFAMWLLEGGIRF